MNKTLAILIVAAVGVWVGAIFLKHRAKSAYVEENGCVQQPAVGIGAGRDVDLYRCSDGNLYIL